MRVCDYNVYCCVLDDVFWYRCGCADKSQNDVVLSNKRDYLKRNLIIRLVSEIELQNDDFISDHDDAMTKGTQTHTQPHTGAEIEKAKNTRDNDDDDVEQTVHDCFQITNELRITPKSRRQRNDCVYVLYSHSHTHQTYK